MYIAPPSLMPSRLLESRSQKRQIAEEQQEKLRNLLGQRDRTENEFREANSERIRRSKSCTLPTPTTPCVALLIPAMKICDIKTLAGTVLCETL